MEEELEYEEQIEHEKLPRKRKFGLYAFVVVFLALLIILLGLFVIFHIQKIEVEGNERSSKDDIIQWVQKKPYMANSLFVLSKHKFTKVENLPIVGSVKLSMKAPWTIHVKITEKKVVGYMVYEDHYVFFDEEGSIIDSSVEFQEEVILVEGIESKKMELGKTLAIENKNVLHQMLNVIKLLKKEELNPDKIVFEQTRVILHFGTISVKLGDKNFDEKILQISPILEKLGEESGILHLENFGEASESISFEKQVPEEEAAD